MVYVDIDKVAVAHSKAILEGDDRATVIEANLREPEAILGHPETRRLIDFDQPVGLLLVQVLPFIRDEEQPGDLVKALTRPLVSGSYLVISHSTFDEQSASVADAMRRLYTRASAPVNFRGRAEISGFFEGFDLFAQTLEDRFVPLLEDLRGHHKNIRLARQMLEFAPVELANPRKLLPFVHAVEKDPGPLTFA